ncbi:hypothetical protein QZH41_017367 [Actinostola sp. cb2023]|nr:hypothetical protein QZH41_017367 [Actinostola sp. cb2023]
MAEEEVNKLASSLKQMQDKFVNDWKGPFEKQLDDKTKEHQENMDCGKEILTQIEEKISWYNEESNRKLEVLQQQAEEVSSLEKQLKELQIYASTLLEKKEQEQKALKEKETHLERMGKDIQAKEEATNYKLQQFVKGTQFFENRLGLSFKKIDEDFCLCQTVSYHPNYSLQFVFKFIDPNDWEKAFFFSVSVGEDKCYTVKDCNPPVEGLATMVQELNEKENFSKFVINMRKKFKETTSH